MLMKPILLGVFILGGCTMVSSFAGASSVYSADHIIMPWLCLQRCQFNVSQVKEHIEGLYQRNCEYHTAHHHQSTGELSAGESPLVNLIAFEKFNLGPNASLVHNTDLFNASQYIGQVFSQGAGGCTNQPLEMIGAENKKRAMPLPMPKRIAMVSSYPYPKDFLHWMRQLFSSDNGTSSSWIQELGRVCQVEGIDGVNIDFEPPTSATAQDAADYGLFLDRLRRGLWKFKPSSIGVRGKRGFVRQNGQLQEEEEGIVLTVTTATWSTLWNLTEIAAALEPSPQEDPESYGYATTMNTYTFHDHVFDHELRANIAAFGEPPKFNSSRMSSSTGEGWRWLITGLETWPRNFIGIEVQHHFDSLKEHNLCRLAMWKAPIPEHFWSHLKEMTKRCRR